METEEDVMCVLDLYLNSNTQRMCVILFDTYSEPIKFSKMLIEDRITKIFKQYDYSPHSTKFVVRKIEGEVINEDDIAHGGSVCYTSEEFRKLRLIKNENQESEI